MISIVGSYCCFCMKNMIQLNLLYFSLKTITQSNCGALLSLESQRVLPRLPGY